MKNKLHFTINSLIEKKACDHGMELFKNYLEENNIKYDNDTKFNLLLLLDSNGVNHTIWALVATIEDSRSVSVEIAKRAATRAEKYADTAARAAYAADAARAAYCASAYAAYSVKYSVAAKYADDADRAASYAADAADAAERTRSSADYYHAHYEIDKQKQDLLEILEND